MTPELRAHYLDLIAQCGALPHDEKAQIAKRHFQELLGPPAPEPADAFADKMHLLISALVVAQVRGNVDDERTVTRQIRQMIAAAFMGASANESRH